MNNSEYKKDSMSFSFSDTLKFRVDKLRKTRKVHSKIAHCKYTSKNYSELAAKIGLNDNVKNRLINDYYLINRLANNYSHQSNTKKTRNIHGSIQLSAIPLGVWAKWLIKGDEIETIVMYYIYIESKSYNQISEDVVLLTQTEIINLQIKNFKELAANIMKRKIRH